MQPNAPPAPSISQPSDPIKIEPNPFLSTNPFAQTDSHLPEIHEIDEERRVDFERIRCITTSN